MKPRAKRWSSALTTAFPSTSSPGLKQQLLASIGQMAVPPEPWTGNGVSFLSASAPSGTRANCLHTRRQCGPATQTSWPKRPPC
jgi:hypothetical protein